MDDLYIYVITALMPLSACMLIFQVNPYSALVLRGVLGAVAVLVYVILGAADVGLTEALMGTLLAIALYIITLRSSMVMRLGVLKEKKEEKITTKPTDFEKVIEKISASIAKYYLRLEIMQYENKETLEKALMEKEIHGICIESKLNTEISPYNTKIRIKRIYDMLQTDLLTEISSLDYVNLSKTSNKNE